MAGFTYNKSKVIADAFSSVAKRAMEDPSGYAKSVTERFSPELLAKVNLGVTAGLVGGGILGAANSDNHPIVGGVVGAGLGYGATSIAAGIACAKKLI